MNKELIAMIGRIEWEFQKRLWTHCVGNVVVKPKIRAYHGESFTTYDIFVRTKAGEVARIRILPNFAKNVVEVCIKNKPVLMKAIEEAMAV